MENSKPRISFILAVLPIFIIMVLLLVGYGVYRVRAEVLLVIGAFLTGIIARAAGFSWETMQTGIIQNITKALPAMLIVICVAS